MPRTPALIGKSTAELEDLVVALGEPRFRGRQLAHRIYRHAGLSFEAIPELPSALRARLAESFRVTPLEVATHVRSVDEVDKLLVHGGDEQLFECVLLPYEDRVSCCLSSQVGCPMACTFCATGLGGFQRNLDAGEIVGQYLQLQSISSRRIDHVVFMGMGEPLLNLDALLRAMELLHDEVGLSYRNLTVSTVGLVPQIRRLAELKLPIHVALSLHSPFDEVRERLMPVNHKWPVAEVVGAMKDYQRATGRKATFEYLLIEDLNDTPDQARALARLVKGMPHVVNLIPFNSVNTQEGYRRPSSERVRSFRTALERFGVNVTQRVERGHDIAAACGQLAGRHQGQFGKGRRAPSDSIQLR